MTKTSKLLGTLVISTLLWVTCTFAYTQEQQDAYQWAYQYRITTQPTIEAANLNWNVTRQELAKMLTNYIDNVVWWMNATISCTFTDEDKISWNLKPYTKKICAYKIMWSNWQDFRPTGKVTRAELGTTISRMLWWDKYNVNWKDYYVYHLNALKDQWIMNNINDPVKSHAKRWDTFIMLKRIYDKYYSTSTYSNTEATTSEEEYISEAYSNSNVIYESKNWKKYYYNADFLKILKALANKQWESDLKKYLEIEIAYYEDENKMAELNSEKINEMLWFDLSNIDSDNLSDKEKRQMIKDLKKAKDSILQERENRNDKYLNKLDNVVKNIQNDKFGLKDKYQETKTFTEETISFLDKYLDSMLEIAELSINEEDINSEEWFALVLWLMWSMATYNAVASNYQEYVENRAIDTIGLLWLK